MSNSNLEFEYAISEQRISALTVALKELQKSCIGVYLIHGTCEMITHIDNDTVHTIKVGTMLGASTCVYSRTMKDGIIHLIPSKFENFYDMVQTPFAFSEWLYENKLINPFK